MKVILQYAKGYQTHGLVLYWPERFDTEDIEQCVARGLLQRGSHFGWPAWRLTQKGLAQCS